MPERTTPVAKSPAAKLRWLAALALATTSLACEPDKPAENPRFDPSKLPGAELPPPPPTLPGPPALPSQVIAEIASESASVDFVRNGDRGLLLVRSEGTWKTGPVDLASDEPVADGGLVVLADAPTSERPYQLRPHGDGFVLVWTDTSNAGEDVHVLGVDSSGHAQGKRETIASLTEPVRWVDVLSSGAAATVIWETRSGAGSQVHARPWNQPNGAPLAVVERAASWHAAATDTGAIFCWVAGSDVGSLHARELRDGKLGPEITIAAESALADAQVAVVGDRRLIGWTDTSRDDHAIKLAVLGADGKLASQPRTVMPPIGGQAQIALLASEDRKRALLAWEREIDAVRGRRRVRLATLNRDGALEGPRAILDLHGDGTPQLIADRGGFSALTIAPTTEGGRLVPYYVRLDASLAVTGAEPIRLATLGTPDGIPDEVRSLSCHGGRCTLLARGNDLLALATLPGVALADWPSPAATLPEPEPPLAEQLTSLLELETAIAEVAAAELPDGRSLVAWVTHYQEEGSGPAPAGATLAYCFIDAAGKAGPVFTLSERAISIGGVTVLPLEDDKAAALIGWAGPNAGASQVFVSKIGKDGDKLLQRTVTQIRRPQKDELPNEVADVALTPDGKGGTIVAWSDSRDGNAEIYVARVSDQLTKTKTDRRVSSSPGPSTEPELARAGDDVIVVWSESTDGAPADIMFASLDEGLETKIAPRKLQSSEGHSRTPRFAGTGDALVVGWIDEAHGDDPAALRLLAIDARGQGQTAARRVFVDGDVTSAMTRCRDGRCRGLLTAVQGSVNVMASFDSERDSGAPVPAKPLFQLPGGTLQDSSLSGGDSLTLGFFIQSRGRSSVIRQLNVRW